MRLNGSLVLTVCLMAGKKMMAANKTAPLPVNNHFWYRLIVIGGSMLWRKAGGSDPN
jgi:hypothetical protein